jgi:hypothetical protein
MTPSLLAVLVGLFAFAQGTSPCASAAHDQFDFWVGTWEVRTAQAALAGTNTITREHGGCVVVERWVGARGMTGSSLNVYVPSTGRWHQTWADSSGLLLELSGEFKNGVMQLTGRGQGIEAMSRITWTPNADGSVRQLWEESKNNGRSWRAVFDGTYRRKGAA